MHRTDSLQQLVKEASGARDDTSNLTVLVIDYLGNIKINNVKVADDCISMKLRPCAQLVSGERTLFMSLASSI